MSVLNYFILNVLLGAAWAALSGQFTLENLAAGYAIGYVVLWLARGTLGQSSYFVKVPQAFGFAGYFLWELIKANVRVAYEVLTPGHTMRPAIVAIPLDVRTPLAITLLAQMITLTPGTLSLDVSSDRRVLYVHAMYVDDVDAFRRSIKNGFERRLRDVLS
ncbi:MAG: Na+/H+ antiporter subunit E [Aggregatilineales bacterium]